MKKGRLHISVVEIQFVEGRIRVCGGDGEQVGAIKAGAHDAFRSLFSRDHVRSTCLESLRPLEIDHNFRCTSHQNSTNIWSY
jgi:hypothetical protein